MHNEWNYSLKTLLTLNSKLRKITITKFIFKNFYYISLTCCYDNILCKSVVQRVQRENLNCVEKMVALSEEAIAVDRFINQDDIYTSSAMYGGYGYGGRFSERRQSSLFNETNKSSHNSSENYSNKSSKNEKGSGRKGKRSK